MVLGRGAPAGEYFQKDVVEKVHLIIASITRMISVQDSEAQGILPWPRLAFFLFTHGLVCFSGLTEPLVINSVVLSFSSS